MKRPWMKFYVGDWLQHPGLRLCSLAAQGLWIRLMCLMHQAKPYGHLRVGSRALDVRGLARLVGEDRDAVEELLRELEDAAVYSRTADGEIYSPRMVRDDAKHAEHVAYGRRGGNPHLKGTGKRGDNPPPKGRAQGGDTRRDKAQKSEVRRQKSISAVGAEPPGGDESGTSHAKAIRAWCEVFEQETGQSYPFDGSADGNQIKRLRRKPDFNLEELRRRAGVFLADSFWAEQGVDLKRFVSQWTALGTAGRKVNGGEAHSKRPTEEDLEWARRALADTDEAVREQGLRSIRTWGLTAEEVQEGGA